ATLPRSRSPARPTAPSPDRLTADSRPPAAPPHRIRITLSRGATASGIWAPALSENRTRNPLAPGACNTRWYTAPEPERIVPETLTPVGALTSAVRGKLDRTPHALFAEYTERNAHFLYWSSGGAAKFGASETQFASAHRSTRVAKG